MESKIYLAMHWDSDKHIHASSSLKNLVVALNDGRRGPSKLHLSHAWDCVVYRSRHHKAWCFRVCTESDFENLAARGGWAVIRH